MNEEHFTFQLQYKHSGTFANLKSYPPKSENVRPHSGNPIETVTPSSGTPQLASYKEARENELRERIPVPRDNFFLNQFKVRARAAKVIFVCCFREPRGQLSPPPRSFTYAIFRAVFDSRSLFFAPKPHGNACYAG